ncbi:MAG: hypothetical protein Aurels2KO_52290 [Aureliella sp.]
MLFTPVYLNRNKTRKLDRGSVNHINVLTCLTMTCAVFMFSIASSGSTARAQDFEVIDFPYSIKAMSGDGQYFVSGSKRYDMNLNQVELGDLPGGRDSSYFPAINNDGSVCAGYSESGLGREACVWTEETGIVGLGFVVTRITGVSDDGLAVAGILGYADGNAPFYWSAAVGVVPLPEARFVNGLSADGTVVMGYGGLDSSGLSSHGFTWTPAGGYENIGRLHGAYSPPSDELSLSADGTTVVGKSYYEAFCWTEATGLQYLGDLSTEENESSHAHDSSAEGSVVVGMAKSDGAYGANPGYEAFIWTEVEGMVSLNTMLMDAGVELGGLKFETVLFISDDGRRMLVEARDPYHDTQLCYVDLDAEATEPPAPTNRYGVVNQYRRLWQYELDGSLLGEVLLEEGNDKPKGIASNESGTTWVIDDTDSVFVYDAYGTQLGSWKATGLSRPEGIAVLGNDLLIIDRGLDKVLVFEDATTWVDGRTASATRSWKLATSKGNKNARGITTDGTSIWVVNTARKDRIYKYSTDGNYQGRFVLDASVNNKNPRGITVSSNGATLSVVDITADTVFHYSAANPGQGAFDAFLLNSGNSRPEGIAEVFVP